MATSTLRWTLLVSMMCLAPAPGFALPIQPPDLAPGQLYHWMFVTFGARDAQSTSIDVYNDFVRAEAALNPSLTGTDDGLAWYAIGSTDAVDAKVNAAVSGPVYLLDGTRFADGFVDMWSGAPKPRPNIDQFGLVRPFDADPMFVVPWVWTGSSVDGTAHGFRYLGASVVTAGRYSYSADSDQWITWDQYNSDDHYPLYALSAPIKANAVPVPEPATAGLLLVAASWPVAARVWRGRWMRPRSRSVVPPLLLAIGALASTGGAVATTEPRGSQRSSERRPRSEIVVPRDAATIQEAIDSVRDGGTVVVLPGLYREVLHIVGKRVRVSGSGVRRTVLAAPRSADIDPAERATGLVNYAEGGGGVFEDFTLRGGLNGIVGQPIPGNRPSDDPPLPAESVTVNRVEIEDTGRGILWRTGTNLTVRDVRIERVRRHGVVVRGSPGSAGYTQLFDLSVNQPGSFGIVVMDTPSIGCQTQIVNPQVNLAQDGGIGVFRSGVCIFGGLLFLNRKAGIRFEESAGIVDGTRILNTLDEQIGDTVAVGVGILAYLSDLQRVVNASIEFNKIGLFAVGSAMVLGWDDLTCNAVPLGAQALSAGSLGPGTPPVEAPYTVSPLFPPDGGLRCGCGATTESCHLATAGPPALPPPVGGLE